MSVIVTCQQFRAICETVAEELKQYQSPGSTVTVDDWEAEVEESGTVKQVKMALTLTTKHGESHKQHFRKF